jgi:hypothetical protein
MRFLDLVRPKEPSVMQAERQRRKLKLALIVQSLKLRIRVDFCQVQKNQINVNGFADKKIKQNKFKVCVSVFFL